MEGTETIGQGEGTQENPVYINEYLTKAGTLTKPYKAPRKARESARLYWCFTLNLNVEHDDHPQLDWEEFDNLKYGIYQLEMAATGQPHYQGYVEFNYPGKRLTALKKILPRAHWEERRGSAEQARVYCTPTKGVCDEHDPTYLDGPWETGKWEPQSQGKRNDLNEIVDMIKRGNNSMDILNAYPGQFVRYHSGITKAMSVIDMSRPRVTTPEVIFCYGEPGTGKSFWAGHSCPTADQYWKYPDKWWDGYRQQGTIILDDFTGWLPYHEWLRLCDGNPLTPEIKGAHTSINSPRIIITSNFLPTEWWKKITVNSEAILRRITKFLVFENKGEEPAEFGTYAQMLTYLYQ